VGYPNTANESKAIWVVVLVQSGIPTLVEAYEDEETAKNREEVLREDIRPDYDETGVFEVEIGVPSSD
jgi:hypothetical protein